MFALRPFTARFALFGIRSDGRSDCIGGVRVDIHIAVVVFFERYLGVQVGRHRSVHAVFGRFLGTIGVAGSVMVDGAVEVRFV